MLRSRVGKSGAEPSDRALSALCRARDIAPLAKSVAISILARRRELAIA